RSVVIPIGSDVWQSNPNPRSGATCSPPARPTLTVARRRLNCQVITLSLHIYPQMGRDYAPVTWSGGRWPDERSHGTPVAARRREQVIRVAGAPCRARSAARITAA